jgi:hypothetical protein
MLLLLWRSTISPLPVLETGRSPLVGCPRLLIQYIRSYPPYLEAVPTRFPNDNLLIDLDVYGVRARFESKQLGISSSGGEFLDKLKEELLNGVGKKVRKSKMYSTL